jgi:phenylpropionate dioxygenase-like ring-hydroxylating dioxygenase large terminal subunit
MIKNVNYINKEIFDVEMESIHNSSWIFVCLKAQISENNDYVTYDVGKKNLVIQNFEGTLKCFENICLHRFNKIQNNKFGNSPFFCSYHSWFYDSEGNALVNDSFKKQLEIENRNCLKEYKIDFSGDFVFVKVNDLSTDSLKEHLGEFYDILIELSTNFDSLINKDSISICHKANWKLLVENVLECYHCSSVHKETLVPIGIGNKKPENHVINKYHDMIDYPIRIGKKQNSRNERLSFLENRSLKHNSLRHIYIFPNLFITSTDGLLFYVGKLTPESCLDTNLLVNFIRPVINNLSRREFVLSNAFYESSLESSQKVIFEDRVILESIQKNLPLVEDKIQIFGEEEFRLLNFHNNIKKNVKYI